MSPTPEHETLIGARDRAAARLLAARATNGCWEGELSSSALSTATAVCALLLHARGSQGTEADRDHERAAQGLDWLLRNVNADGGYGDTVASPSNVSTTCLAWAALSLHSSADAAQGVRGWIERDVGTLSPETLRSRLEAVYGEDRTFAVPILTLLALVDPLGVGQRAFQGIPRLPFELAALPQRAFHLLGLPVVSYAMPALIAIGQVLHAHAPTPNPLARLARNRTVRRTLDVLESIQPSSGGFLEAAPLTSFVVASLTGCGQEGHPVTHRGLEFLRASQRDDGSWPIDTNLATWVTSLSVDALAAGGRLATHLDAGERERVRAWLAGQQTRTIHPYTRAAAGAWAWTDLPGGVPDADDTPGALVALAHLGDFSASSASAGVRWLIDLQNRDGGIPTFCRGWGRLPFDRSTSDLTAHALRAFAVWRHALTPELGRRCDRATDRAMAFLVMSQAKDGSWVPLWFGNQDSSGLENPTYGTSRVLKLGAWAERSGSDALRRALDCGRAWMLAAQHADGGWGGAAEVSPSVEETALALDGLAAGPRTEDVGRAVERGGAWLAAALEEAREPAPIGLYFARLWYHEKLYPGIFATAALERSVAYLRDGSSPVLEEAGSGSQRT